MDKLLFFKRMAEQHPEDAEAVYWLAKEYAERGQWIDAIGQFSAGLAICTDDRLRAALISGLTEATASLRGGNTGGQAVPVDTKSQGQHVGVADGSWQEEDDGEPLDQDDDFEEEDFEEEVHTDEKQISQPLAFANSSIGLQVLDGGKTQAAPALQLANKVTFADVAGLKDLKKTIQLRIISPFQNKDLFSKFRKKAGGGVLLYGPPGCGKTFIAKATAGECRAAFIPVQITDILDKYIGESEMKLKHLFDRARSQKPSVMFFDEIDTIGLSRSQSSSHMRGLIDTFLSEMEGIDTNTDQVLVIGATNMPWDVDSALKRPGRFDQLVFVAPPDEEAREQIFQLKLAGRYCDKIDTRLLASRTEFFSGADIENLCERAAERALSEILETGVERPILMADFEALFDNVRPSTLEWLRTAKNYVKYANQSGVYNDVEDYMRKHGRRI